MAEGKGATSVLRNVAGRVDIDRSLHQASSIPAVDDAEADESRTDTFPLQV
jgi:hypothetical protein